ncbi:hypothetical protein ACIBCB_18220 [Streptomyces uncialis]|uniref:hypothetical protein n=1 Tax=Streptomyces uncialis TaxID=1048205 RepID=UPI00379CAD44
MTEIVTSGDARFRARLVTDEYATNPRENHDHLGYVITIDTHLGHYAPVDEDGGPLAQGWGRVSWNRWKGVEIFTRWARIFHGAIVVESRPPQGAVSLWYLMPEDAQDLGLLPEAYLNAEREEYEAWAAGEAFGIIIEQSVDWRRADGRSGTLTTWAEVDSSWGYYGHCWALTEACRNLAQHAGTPELAT